MKSDIEIARAAKISHISEIAEKLNLSVNDIEMYGKYKAKIPLKYIDNNKVSKGKLILVTAITPTPAGEGKTTTSIGLSMGMNKRNYNTTVVLREPSLGPVFGMKGGAAGGGFSQVIPMEDINLHFTGDLSAVEKAHNLLAALIDNNIHNNPDSLKIDPRTVQWKRAIDMNERALRKIIIGLGGKKEGVPRESGFNITAASEVMAILCMAENLKDLKERLGNIYIADTYDGKPVFARDIKANGAMAALLRDAMMPNLVQTLEGTPAIIHGGPFANIAQGTNTIVATKMGLSLSDYVVTEAGFASELGAEKFFNIKCRQAGLSPSAVVIVATIRALKYHGGAKLKELATPNIDALKIGFLNLDKHIENIRHFGINPIVSINRFATDSKEEIQALISYCDEQKVKVALNESWEKGGEGAVDLAEMVVASAKQCKSCFNLLYDTNLAFEEKIEIIAKKMYGAKNVEYSVQAKSALNHYREIGFGNLAVCMAKTQKSLSDDPYKKGRPENFTVKIKDVELSAGAGFIVPIAGSIMRMPGLPSVPSAETIDIDENGNISGLF